jgi:branched-chain amino acid aminotransferase
MIALRSFLKSPNVMGQSSLFQVSRRSISSSQLTVKTTDTSRLANSPKKENLVFGTTFSDHMLMCEWETVGGWKAPRIVPYQDLKISPAASSLQYGT